MKLVSFTHHGGAVCGGVLEGDAVRPFTSSGKDSVLAFIEAGISQPELAPDALPLTDVQLLAPIQRPPRIFGIGLNYREHAAESKMAVQAVPTVFMKLSSSVVGPDADVILAPEAGQPDYEGELGVIIGRGGYRIQAADWEQHVFGYSIINDISAREVQLATTQWTLGKSFPTFTPFGPSIVTRDEVPDPHNLAIRLTLAGEVMQDSNTSYLIFRIPELIAYISAITPLEVGDLISTGTPPGVGLGRSPQRWIKPGEEMVLEVERLGVLRNRAVAGS